MNRDRAAGSGQQTQAADLGNWSSELLQAYSTVDELAAAGLVSVTEAVRLAGIGSRFRVRLPRYYAQLIDTHPVSRDSCPIRKQAIPNLGEEDPELPTWAKEWSRKAYGRDVPWTDDAIGDVEKLGAPRITHRYENRAIVHVSSACAMYCRYCFRKSHLNDAERTLYAGSLEPALDYLRAHAEIREVILTGGDPLSLTDAALSKLLDRIEEIAHVSHVRIHSKMPCTLPSRLTESLAETLADRRFVVSVVAHFNHPRELTPTALQSLARLRKRGIPLYNQSVLLKGVNDSADSLYTLFQMLFENGVSPFYLHHPDWTPGTFAFRLPIARGRQIMTELAGRLAGPAMPAYVLDLPGGRGKVDLLSSRVTSVESKREGSIGGALHEIAPSRTRETSSHPALYAEFWKE